MPSYKQKKAKLRELVKKQEQERINKIQNEGYQFKATDAFRVAQKRYKYYIHRDTDYSQVVKLADLKHTVVDGYQVYEIKEPQGAFLIKGFIGMQTQFQIGFQALNDYIRRPYRTNLDGTNGLYLQQHKQQPQNQKEQSSVEEQIKKQMNQSQSKVQTKEKLYQINAQESKVEDIQKGYFFNENIRMANLGYQYDWPHRSYPKTQVPIPKNVHQMTRKAQNLYQKLSNKQDLEYHGEAVIVNYYKPRDYMVGHLDDGEEDQINPIFSFCFGLSCIFLLGFPDKQRAPLAIKLEAGDLLIMSGYSRICYHGVPRIIQNSFNSPEVNEQLQKIAQKIDKQLEQPHRINGFKQIINYFKQHRLNLNIRQVWRRKGELERQEV